jgi:hypothetical protein
MMASQWGQRLSALTNPDAQATATAMREEWRAETEAASADALDGWRHDRTLRDIAIEAVHRGDPVVVVLPNVRFFGMVETVGPDLLSLQTVSGRVDVHLCDAVQVVIQIGERVKDGGARESVSEGDFRSALLAREQSREVTLGSPLYEEPLDGRLVVGADHVCLIGRGGGETYFPFWSVSYVMPRRD